MLRMPQVCLTILISAAPLAVTSSATAETTVLEGSCVEPGCADHDTGAVPRLTVLPDVGLSLELPAVWRLQRPQAGPFAAVAELPPKQALAMLTRTAVGPQDSPTQGLDDLIAELPRSFERYEVLATGRRQLAGELHGDVLEVRGTARGRTLRHTTYLIEGHGERFALTFATPDLKHPELAPRFERIAASLELAGPNPHNARFLELIRTAPRDLAGLRETLDSGADIDAEDGDGFTALAVAVLSRDGLLTKWLLEQGADPRRPEKLASLLPLAATPPIRELLVAADPSLAGNDGNPSEPFEIEWVSPEAQLFVGIQSGRLAEVEEALEAGADLTALEPGYRLNALALTRKLIEEFEQLELDPSRFLPIEKLLTRAVSPDTPGNESPGLAEAGR